MNAALTHPRPTIPLTIAALAAYWTAVIVSMHVLEPEFDPVKDYLSAYVLGAHGVWMTTSFFAAAAIWFLLAFGLGRDLPPTFWTRAGIVLVFVAGCGDVVMGFFPTQWPLTPPLTQQTALHLLGALVAFYAIALGSISFSVSFRRAEHWRPISTAAIAVSLLMFAMLSYRWFSRPGSNIDGLMQRIIVALMLLWATVVLSRWIQWSPKTEASMRR
jgi:Protein of unknown function (DUF998)